MSVSETRATGTIYIRDDGFTLDDIAAAWGLVSFGPYEFRLKFVPADWDGRGYADRDFAIGIEAGGRGMLPVLSSVFETLLDIYARDERTALRDLSRFLRHKSTLGWLTEVMIEATAARSEKLAKRAARMYELGQGLESALNALREEVLCDTLDPDGVDGVARGVRWGDGSARAADGHGW